MLMAKFGAGPPPSAGPMPTISPARRRKTHIVDDLAPVNGWGESPSNFEESEQQRHRRSSSSRRRELGS